MVLNFTFKIISIKTYPGKNRTDWRTESFEFIYRYWHTCLLISVWTFLPLETAACFWCTELWASLDDQGIFCNDICNAWLLHISFVYKVQTFANNLNLVVMPFFDWLNKFIYMCTLPISQCEAHIKHINTLDVTFN